MQEFEAFFLQDTSATAPIKDYIQCLWEVNDFVAKSRVEIEAADGKTHVFYSARYSQTQQYFLLGAVA